MPSRSDRRPPAETHPSQKEFARVRFIESFLRQRRGAPSDGDRVKAGAAFETWWATGIAGGKFIVYEEGM